MFFAEVSQTGSKKTSPSPKKTMSCSILSSILNDEDEEVVLDYVEDSDFELSDDEGRQPFSRCPELRSSDDDTSEADRESLDTDGRPFKR
jgi:hypothetical protein